MINDKTCKFNDDQQGLTTGLSANAKQVDDVHMAPYLLHYLHFLVIMIPIMVVLIMMTLTNAVMTTMTMTMMMTNHLNKVNHLAISVTFLQHLNCHSDRLSDNDKYDDDDNVT